jgi:DNA repair photolyase
MATKGKAIYRPAGKAGEYAEFACNFYVGCSNGCTYCYCKKGVLGHAMGGDTPTLKKCFRNEQHAITVFFNELYDPATGTPRKELMEHGIFFTFSSDPCLPETQTLNFAVINACLELSVPVKILTKCVAWMNTEHGQLLLSNIFAKTHLAVGFTLTGHDDLEPGAATNAERIEAMKHIHRLGIKTFASIEPVVDIPHSKLMIENSIGYCNLYKIGLQSGKKLPREDVRSFVQWVLDGSVLGLQPKVYFKDGLLAQAGIARESLPANCVGRDYSLFGL